MTFVKTVATKEKAVLRTACIQTRGMTPSLVLTWPTSLDSCIRLVLLLIFLSFSNHIKTVKPFMLHRDVHVHVYPCGWVVHKCTCAAICPKHTEAYTPGPPLPRNGCALTSGPVTHQRLDTHTRKSGRKRMLLLVFFLSHVDDSRDKVLKLAPLEQLQSKVNLKSANCAAGSVYFQ